jgi:hypothetical protein
MRWDSREADYMQHAICDRNGHPVLLLTIWAVEWTYQHMCGMGAHAPEPHDHHKGTPQL